MLKEKNPQVCCRLRCESVGYVLFNAYKVFQAFGHFFARYVQVSSVDPVAHPVVTAVVCFTLTDF